VANGSEVPVALLQNLLRNNIFGVDPDGGAARVTAFSLYLAMCDELDPKRLWEHPDTVFPALRGASVIEGDFFNEAVPGLRTEEDAGSYDLVIGNPPWGDRTLKTSADANTWAERGWSLANKDFGILFLAKAIELVRPGGRVGLVQSAGALLYNEESTARSLQRRIFTEHRRVESVTLFPPRLNIFRGAKVPTCVIILENRVPDDSPFLFEAPKRRRTTEDTTGLVLDVYDVHWITPTEVLEEPWIWSVLAYGDERDRALIRRLQRLPTLRTLKSAGIVDTREGLNRGNRKYRQDALVGMRYLGDDTFPEDSTFHLDGAALPKIADVRIDANASKKLTAFELPQMLVKRSLLKDDGRFQARLVGGEPIICEKKYVSVHGPREVLESACLIYNSDIATYFLFLTSGRFAFDRNNPNISDLLSVPLPKTSGAWAGLLGGLSEEEVQQQAFERLGLNEVERTLVTDFVRYTFADARGSEWRGLQPTRRNSGEDDEPDLRAYSSMYRRVVQSAYGADASVLAEIAGSTGHHRLPVRVVRITIGPRVRDDVDLDAVSLAVLRERLAEAYRNARKLGGSLSLRCLRVYETNFIGGERHLSITYVKPDAMRFWTQSTALRDADELALDVSVWAGAEDNAYPRGEVA
jgi:hypothetical protein